jgi:hypothetical protein
MTQTPTESELVECDIAGQTAINFERQERLSRDDPTPVYMKEALLIYARACIARWQEIQAGKEELK